MGSSSMYLVSLSEKEIWTQTLHRGTIMGRHTGRRWPCDDRGKDWTDAPTKPKTSQESRPSTKARRGQEGFSPRAVRENTALLSPESHT